MIREMTFEEIKGCPGKKYIFGVTINGLFLAKYLTSDNQEIYFLDNNKAFHEAEVVDNIKCVDPQCVDKKSLCVITLAREENILAVYEQLKQLGCENIIKVNIDAADEYRECLDRKTIIECLWFSIMKYKLDWNNLKTLDEKMQWLKLYDRREEYVQLADKFRAREYIKENFGQQYLIPLLFVTEDYREINKDTIPDEHCAIKSNCWSGDVEIVRSKEAVDWKMLQDRFKKIMQSDYSKRGGEWWYSRIKPCIVVEKLLETSEGHIPNDYKLHFINGNLEFIYCSIDREGSNYRKIYSPTWEQMPFAWNGTGTPPELDKPDIECPKTFNDMVRMGKVIAQNIPYVRVDYYDVDGKLYFGEITISHGAGFDRFIPSEYDMIYGEKLILPEAEYNNETCAV